VAGWRQERDGLAWWGGNLALLNDTSAGRSVLARQRQLAALDRPEAALRWVLGPEAASTLLQQWRPWTLLSSVAGGPLAPGLQSFAVALAPETNSVRWSARLQFAETSHG
jgi:hypothetical protein